MADNPGRSVLDKVVVTSLDSLPTQVGGIITLENKFYDFSAFQGRPLILPFTIKPPSAGICRISNGTIVFVKENGTLFENTSMTNTAVFQIADTVFLDGTVAKNTKIFDIDGTDWVLFSASPVFQSFGALGDLNSGSVFAASNTAFVGFKTGINFDDSSSSISFTRCTVAGTNQSTNIFNFTGSHGTIDFGSNSIVYSPNESVFNIDALSTVGAGSISNNVLLDNGGEVFASGSKTQTDPSWQYNGNNKIENSTVRADMFVTNNQETTTVTQEVPASINATWGDAVERFVREHQLDYDTETGNFTVGQIVIGGTSGAFGTITEVNDSGTDGNLIVQDIGGIFEESEIITDPVTGSASITKVYTNKVDYDTETGNFTVGQIITGGTSGAIAIITSITDNGTTGTLFLRPVPFTTNETITDPVTGSANLVKTSSYAKSTSIETVTVSCLSMVTCQPASGGSVLIHTHIALNDKIIESSEGANLIISGTNNQRQIISMTHVEIKTDDKLAVFIENVDNTTSIDVISSKFLINKT